MKKTTEQLTGLNLDVYSKSGSMFKENYVISVEQVAKALSSSKLIVTNEFAVDLLESHDILQSFQMEDGENNNSILGAPLTSFITMCEDMVRKNDLTGKAFLIAISSASFLGHKTKLIEIAKHREQALSR